MIHVDLDSPRISRTRRRALFLPHGGNTEFLERMSSVLLAIHQGIEATPPFIAALLEHDLLESFVLDVELSDGSQHRLAGFYIINEERLRRLDAARRSNAAQGGLPAGRSTWRIASLSNFRALIERQNRLNAAIVEKSRRSRASIRGRCPDDVLTSTQPLVLARAGGELAGGARGPRIRAGGDRTICAGSIEDATVGALLGAPDIGGRFFYNDDSQRLQFQARCA